MDVICRAVFEKIASACTGGGYAIVDSQELSDALPDGERKAAGEIDGALRTLQKGGFIDLKYARGNLYCVAPLKNLPEEQPETHEPPAEASPTVIQLKEKANKKCAALYSLAAFLGGALGGILTCVIAAVL